MQSINANETTLDNAARIEWLIANKLKRIASDSSGWITLYLDPADGRLWEKTYPRGEMHGGGPPLLSYLPVADAKLKYGDAVPSD